MADRPLPGSVLIVGAGLAGLRTAEQLRQRGYAGVLTLLGGEVHPPYDRPPLSKQVLRDEAGQPWLSEPDAFAALDVRTVFGSPARTLDLARRVVVTDDAELSFDALVVATGARPRRVPGVPGATLRTWEDALALRERVTEGGSLTVVGAGLIGCEVAAVARAAGAQVHLVEAQTAPMLRVVGPAVAEHIAALHREHGVQLHLGRTVTGGQADGLLLDDGTSLPGVHVLHAVGTEPETGWLAGSGLDVRSGLVCDATGRAAEGVYGVGDVSAWNGTRSEHWTRAGEQADTVAASILGQEPPATPPAYWWSDQYDVKIQGIGATDGDDVRIVEWGPKARTLALYLRDQRLVGVIAFSAPSAVIKLRTHVAASAPLDDVLEFLGA